MCAALTVVSATTITSQWLTAALNSQNIDARIDSFDIEQVGTGQLGETRRFHLNYAGTPPNDAPQTVVGKFTSDNDVSATTGREMGFYRSEVMFYRELAHRTKIYTPKVYVAEIDAQGDFVLLLEDMAPAKAGDHMSGISVDDTRLAIKEAAKLHASFWNDDALVQQPWLYIPEGAQGFYTTELMESSWQHFEKTYAHKMDPEVIKVCDRYIRHHAAWNAPRNTNRCFSHNDFRADNMLFGGDRVAVVDWQTSNYLGAGMDIAYLLGSAFDRKTRRDHEHELLQLYHEELVSEGVSDYSHAQLMDDYRHYSFGVVAVAIAATVIVKRTERGDQLFMRMVEGGAYQALDNDALDLLAN